MDFTMFPIDIMFVSRIIVFSEIVGDVKGIINGSVCAYKAECLAIACDLQD